MIFHVLEPPTIRPALANAAVLALSTLLAAPCAALAQDLEGPPAAAERAPAEAAPRLVAGVTSLKFPTHREWTSTGVRLRRGERVSVRAWGRARIPFAGNALVDPNGVEGARRVARLAGDAPAFSLIGVVGDDNNDYIRVGKEADFTAARDGVLFLCLNQVDPAGNVGSFDVRVTVGNSSSLSFGAGGGLAPGAPVRPTRHTTADGTKVVQVVPSLDWTNTYVSVKRGDVVTVEAAGRISLDLAGRSAGPEGVALDDPGKLIADKPTGALVAVIGDDNNDFIFVGAKATFTAARPGLLFLGVNEEEIVNNTGSFTARVRVAPAAR